MDKFFIAYQNVFGVIKFLRSTGQCILKDSNSKLEGHRVCLFLLKFHSVISFCSSVHG